MRYGVRCLDRLNIQLMSGRSCFLANSRRRDVHQRYYYRKTSRSQKSLFYRPAVPHRSPFGFLSIRLMLLFQSYWPPMFVSRSDSMRESSTMMAFPETFVSRLDLTVESSVESSGLNNLVDSQLNHLSTSLWNYMLSSLLKCLIN